MTALGSHTPRTRKGPVVQIDAPMADSALLYAGAMTMINSSGLATSAVAAASNRGCPGVATGWASIAIANNQLADGSIVLADNTSSGPLGSGHTSAGLIAMLEEGTFLLPATGTLAAADNLKQCWAADDGTDPCHTTQGSHEPCSGIVLTRITATSGWVRVSATIARAGDMVAVS